MLAERQLQVEWLEGKVADLEDSDISHEVSFGLGIDVGIKFYVYGIGLADVV